MESWNLKKHYTFVAAINIDSILIEYLEELKYEIKKEKMTTFIDVELDRNNSDYSNYSNSE